MGRLHALLAPPLCLGVALVGCPKKPLPADAGPPVASTSASLSIGSPEAAIVEELTDDAARDADADGADGDGRARYDANEDAPLLGTKAYPEENPMRGFRKITVSAAKVRKAPKDGDVIATLPKGTEVWLVAEIFNWYRVRYSDPVTQQRRQGWIYLTTVAGPRSKSCPPNWTWHPEDGGWCDRECTKNADCKAIKGYKCSGTLCFYAAD